MVVIIYSIYDGESGVDVFDLNFLDKNNPNQVKCLNKILKAIKTEYKEIIGDFDVNHIECARLRFPCKINDEFEFLSYSNMN